MSFFADTKLLPEDPILGLPRLFAADPRPHKVNLGIGAYKNEKGLPQVFSSVQKAEKQLLERHLNKEYLPIEGEAEFLKVGTQLLFGEGHPLLSSGELFASQAIGGSGALRIGGELIAKLVTRDIFLPDPTWANHRSIFERSGLTLGSYPYFNTLTQELDFSGLCQSIREMKFGSVILLHGCCHNPTGLCPTPEQWRELSRLIKEQKLLVFFDMAYQGFGKGVEEDAYAVRLFADEGHEMLIAYSFSKNFGLYGERVGMLMVRSQSSTHVAAIASQVKFLIRSNYSTPPSQGERIITTILKSSALTLEWKNELSIMCGRVYEMRKAFVSLLKEKGQSERFSHLIHQEGLFSFMGLSEDQVLRLHQDYGIYMPMNGRINVAGLNQSNLDYTAHSIISVI